MGMTIEQLIKNYQPPADASRVIKSAKIALLVGITGAGKDTIQHELLKDSAFSPVVSHTTRAPRSNNGVDEQDGVDYYYISLERAASMLENGEFVEAKLVHGTVYGTSIEAVRSASEQGVALNNIDVQGVAEYKAVSDEVVAIFVVPPSYDEWVERLKRRYSTEEEFALEWPKRRTSAIAELKKALELPYYHFLINDDLDRAVDVAKDMAKRNDIFTRKDDQARLAARDILDRIQA